MGDKNVRQVRFLNFSGQPSLIISPSFDITVSMTDAPPWFQQYASSNNAQMTQLQQQLQNQNQLFQQELRKQKEELQAKLEEQTQLIKSKLEAQAHNPRSL